MPVVVGLLTVELFISDAVTLKHRRQVVQSLIDRLTNQHNVAVADIGEQHPTRAELAVTTVANEEAHVHRVLNAALRLIEGERRAVCERGEIQIL